MDSAARPAWIGAVDVHYIFVWNTSALTCPLYEVISCGIHEQAERKAQYFQFVTALGGETLHVIHNHNPSHALNVMFVVAVGHFLQKAIRSLGGETKAPVPGIHNHLVGNVSKMNGVCFARKKNFNSFLMSILSYM